MHQGSWLCVVAVSILFATSEAQAAKPQPPKPVDPLIIAVSIGSQHVTVYDNGSPIATAPVSTGMHGRPTPMGVFSVIQKERWHRSNLYSNAPMPYMQRITGQALRSTPASCPATRPRYPAVPYAFDDANEFTRPLRVPHHDVVHEHHDFARLAAVGRGEEIHHGTDGLSGNAVPVCPLDVPAIEVKASCKESVIGGILNARLVTRDRPIVEPHSG